MPRHSHTPRISIAAAVDVRGFSGSPLYHRGDPETTLSAPGWAGPAGVFREPVEFLTGHGSAVSLFDDMGVAAIAGGGAAGDLVLIFQSDQLRLWNAAGGVAWTVEAHADNATFGFDTAGFAIQPGTVVTAGHWRRGVVRTDALQRPPRLRLRRDGGPVTYWPSSVSWGLDLRVMLRSRGDEGDLDDRATLCLEHLDNARFDAEHQRYRWAIDADGHYMWSSPLTNAGGSIPITWLEDGFREQMGASGNEPVQQTGANPAIDCYFQRFDYPSPELLNPDRFDLGQVLGFEARDRRTQRTRGGEMTVRNWAEVDTLGIDFVVDGPADRIDLHRHWIKRVLPRIARRPVFWLFQDWGDSRRAVERGHYSLLQTPEIEGYRGRIPLYLEDEVTNELDWDDGLMSGAAVSLECVLAPADS